MSAGWPFLEFEVELMGEDGGVVHPRVWRRFRLSKKADFVELHWAIQDSCLWTDRLWWALRDEDGYVTEVPHDEAEAPRPDEVFVQTYFTEPGQTAEYLYGYERPWRHRVRLLASGSWPEPKRREFIAGERGFPCEEIADFDKYLELTSPPLDESGAALHADIPGWHPEAFEEDIILRFFDCADREGAHSRHRDLRRQLARYRAGLRLSWGGKHYVVTEGGSLAISQGPHRAVARVQPCEDIWCDCHSVGFVPDDGAAAWLDYRTGTLQSRGDLPEDSPLFTKPLTREFLDALVEVYAEARDTSFYEDGTPREEPQTDMWDDGSMVYFPYFVYRPRMDDLYRLDDEVFTAFDLYCAKPWCKCGNVSIGFIAEDVDAGTVRLELRGRSRPRLEPAPGRRADLSELWIMWLQRNGEPYKYLRKREKQMKAAAAHFLDTGLLGPFPEN